MPMNPRIHKVPGKLWLLAQGDCRTWKLALGRLQGWMPSRSGPGKSDVPLDILIPAIPKDYPTLPSVINSVREHVRHPIGDIFLIAPDSPEIRLIAERYGCLFCNESNQLPIKKSDINYTWQKIDRSGWIFQQLLKLNGDQLG